MFTYSGAPRGWTGKLSAMVNRLEGKVALVTGAAQ